MAKMSNIELFFIVAIIVLSSIPAFATVLWMGKIVVQGAGIWGWVLIIGAVLTAAYDFFRKTGDT